MINAEVSALLERIADLLDIQGENRFRVNAYRGAARSIDALTEDLARLAAEGRLSEIKGVGKSISEHIMEYIEYGRIPALDDLEKRTPPGLVKLLAIPGLGPKKVAKIYHELGVQDVEGLKAVIADGRLAALEGFGETSARKIAEGIAFLETSGTRTPLGIALPLAEGVCAQVAAMPGVRRVQPAGSLRRGEETVGDIDILCVADDGETVVRAFTSLPQVRRVQITGPTKGSVIMGTTHDKEIQVDLRVVPEESFGAALQYFTGSKAHNIRLREMAVKRGWRLNEYGLYQDERILAGDTEEGIYRRFGLPWIPPELRQGLDEFETEDFSGLLELEHIRADLHVHTVASDGRNTIREMADAAHALGYHTLAICDHSKSSVIANGLSIERMRKHIADIRAVARDTPGIRILVGCECDILPDGKLDYPDDLLAECDLVVASIHIAQGKGGKDKLSPTERTLAAIENRYVTIIGHPTGRLIQRRDAMDLDMAKVVQAAAASGTFLEINAAWQRLDLKTEHVRQALAAGVRLTINTDSHSTGELSGMRYGVMTARRGGAQRKDVLNTQTPATLMKWIRAKREN